MWENFLVTERIKKWTYQGTYGSFYFWRTYGGQELDLVEERENTLAGYEFKWSDKKKPKAPSDWVREYKNSTFSLINRDNYLDFVL